MINIFGRLTGQEIALNMISIAIGVFIIVFGLYVIGKYILK